MLKDNWFIFTDINKPSERLANEILDIAKNSIKLNNNFKIVLAGVTNIYKILSN
jgi:hypothetical protein